MLRILSALLLLTPLAARADGADIEGRLQRIEKRLEALERASPPPMSNESSSRARSGKTVEMAAEDFKRYSDNIPLIVTQFRAVPYFYQGKAIGIRIFGVKPDGYFEHLGLQNGDVVTSIDGVPTLDLGTMTRALTPPDVTIGKPITIQLKRLDLPLSIHFAVVPAKP